MTTMTAITGCVLATILLLGCVSAAPLTDQLPDTTGLFFGKRAHPNMNNLLFGRRSYSVADQLPDTTGLFFGKRNHPNMNGLLFGKRNGIEDSEIVEQQCRQVINVCQKMGYGDK